MKIVFVVSNLSYPPNEGAHNQTLLLIKELLLNDVEVTLSGFIKNASSFDTKRLKNDLPGLKLKCITYYSSNYIALATKNIFYHPLNLGEQYDIFHFEGFGVITLSRICKNKPKIMSLIDPWAIRQKNTFTSQKSLFKKTAFSIAWVLSYLYEKFYLTKYNTVHLVSESDTKKASIDYPNVNYKSIPIAFNNLTKKTDYTRQKVLKVIFWGDLNIDYLAKGFTIFIECLHNNNITFPITVDVLGRTSKANFIEKIERNKHLYTNLNFIDWVDDIDKFISSYDCVLLTDTNGTGLKNRAISSMMIGVPLIASSYALEGIVGSNNEHFIKCDSCNEYIEALTEISTNHSFAKKIGINARNIALENYSHNAVFQQWLKLYLSFKNEK
jgi:glycosyltransferase involved in cell wall biosynthesis